MTDAYFRRVSGNVFRPTSHAGGAWQPEIELHMGPVSGLMLHEVQRFLHVRGSTLLASRISLDILGRLDTADVTVSVEVIRPGRTIELLEATAVIAGRAAVRARIWLSARHDTASVAGGAPAPLPAPETFTPWSPSSAWGGGYMASLDARRADWSAPGRAAVWLRTDVAIVSGEPSDTLTRFVTLVDTSNGVAMREAIDQWLFPNIDLTIHLHRLPSGPWVGLDVAVVFGADGQGLTSTVLHDVHGPIGRAEQILAVSARPPSG